MAWRYSITDSMGNLVVSQTREETTTHYQENIHITKTRKSEEHLESPERVGHGVRPAVHGTSNRSTPPPSCKDRHTRALAPEEEAHPRASRDTSEAVGRHRPAMEAAATAAGAHDVPWPCGGASSGEAGGRLAGISALACHQPHHHSTSGRCAACAPARRTCLLPSPPGRPPQSPREPNRARLASQPRPPATACERRRIPTSSRLPRSSTSSPPPLRSPRSRRHPLRHHHACVARHEHRPPTAA